MKPPAAPPGARCVVCWRRAERAIVSGTMTDPQSAHIPICAPCADAVANRQIGITIAGYNIYGTPPRKPLKGCPNVCH